MTTILMSELKPGDHFEMVYRDGVSCGIPMEFVRRDGEFAVCKHTDPKLGHLNPVQLSIPGAMARLLDQPK